MDFVDHDSRVESFFPCRPDLQSLRNHAGVLAARSYPRGQLQAVLEVQAQRFHSGQSAYENIGRVGREDTLVVLTGDPAGLFGGPLSTLWKALSAIKLSNFLNEQGLSAVPVFWMQSRAIDVPQPPSLLLVDREGRRHMLRLGNRSSGDPDSTGVASVPPEIEQVLAGLKEFVGDEATEVLELLRNAYTPGTAISSAFARFFSRLMEDWGLIFVNPDEPDFKELWESFHSRVEPEAERIRELVKAQQLRLAQAGSGSAADLASITTLLFQQTILPGVASVADPHEYSVVACSLPALQALGIPPPVVWPRISATIIETRILKLLERYELRWDDLLAGCDAVIQAVAGRKPKAATAQDFDTVTREISRRLEDLFAALPPEHQSLKEVIEESKSKMIYQVNKMRDKFLAGHDLRQRTIRRQITRACESVAPDRELQERRIASLQFLFRYSAGFVRTVYDKIDIGKFEHQVVVVD